MMIRPNIAGCFFDSPSEFPGVLQVPYIDMMIFFQNLTAENEKLVTTVG
jgi:hypothetical protein